MKKLALLLGSLLVVTATQAKEVVVAPVEAEKEVVVVAEPVVEEAVVVEAAAPALRVTNFGMWTENDNNAGSENGDIGLTYLGMNLGLASENWTHAFSVYKAWTLDSDDGVVSGGEDSRLEIQSMRAFNKGEAFEYSLGGKVRLNKTYDKYYLKGTYKYGMFSGSADLMYVAENGVTKAVKSEAGVFGTENRDSVAVEIMPLNMTFGPVTVGYFFGAGKSVESDVPGEDYRTPSYIEHQFRAYFPLYSAGKFSSDAEFRLGLDKDSKAEYRHSKEEADYGFGNFQKYQVNLKYAYSEDLDITSYYTYEITKYDTHKRDQYYGEFGLGWNYKF